jgi:polysaccharide export outer membrane protein
VAARQNSINGGGTITVVSRDIAKLKIAPGFLLSLNVLDDSDYSGVFRVDEQGNIVVPLIGALHVAGNSASEARLLISQALLGGKILKDPQVQLSILEYIPPEVTVEGEVGVPGKYPLIAPHGLMDVLTMAGGLTALAGEQILITRAEGSAAPLLVHYARSSAPTDVSDVVVNPGDIVQVKRAGLVYVLGGVNRPGGYVLQEEGRLTLLEAIALASGISPTASDGKILLLRKVSDGATERVELPFKRISHGKAQDVALRSDDILYVPVSTLKTVYLNTQSVINTAASAAIYTSILH